MPKKLTLKIDRDGVRKAALTGPEVRAAIREVTERVAARAASIDSSTGGTSPKSEITSAVGGVSRARGYVQATGPAAYAREAKYRILGRALEGSGD